MHRLRSSRPIRQLALAILLLGVLAPTVSRALAAARGSMAPPLDICYAQAPGEPAVAPPTAAAALAGVPLPAQPDGGPQPVPALDHCPLCLLDTERSGPPPAASTGFFHADSGLALPDRQALFFPSPVDDLSLARGPPRLVS